MHRIRVAAAARRVLLSLVVCLTALLLAAPVLAADAKVEKEAQALQKKAIEEDFLNLDYASAIKKLQGGIAKCGGDKCSPAVKGALLRDLGAMQILAGNDGEGRASFAQALGQDATLELDPAYKNPQLEGIWSDVKKKAAAGGGGGGTPPPPPPPGPTSQPSGDFVHTPAPEALVRTPLPVYAEYPGAETIARVIVKYKGQGMSDWKALDLQKSDSGYGGLIPCKDVTQGTMSYYIQGFNAANDPVATSGSRNKPYTVPVKAQIAGPPPSLPGQEPPKQCSELTGAECPPDFPGCNNKKGAGEDCDKDAQCTSGACVGGKCAEKKAGGEDCSKDDECASGTCSDGKCSAAKKGEGEDCEADSDCDSDSCKEGKCSGGGGAGGKFPRIWVGLSIGIDAYLMPGASNVCNRTQGQINSAGYVCADSAGNAWPPDQNTNSQIVPNRSDQVLGGFAHGPLTISLSGDYAITQNIMVGLRAGYELLTMPTGGNPAIQSSFPPFRIEGRFTYLFGKNAITQKFAPFAFGSLGAGEFDAMVPVSVFLNQGGNVVGPGTENAWLTAGPVFVGAGGGVRFLLAKKVAATGALRLQMAFGGAAGSLFGAAPELGIQYGF